ncbi:MAG: hypothetical protein JSS60_03915 [Verrucomicrobia bacterium]|nr:hypothetical protein [Verrucomicrobiota bacterium]
MSCSILSSNSRYDDPVIENPHFSLKKTIIEFETQKETAESTIWAEAGDEYNVRRVKEKISAAQKEIKFSLWIEDGGEKQCITLQKILGDGGQKKAWEVSEKSALLLPNYDTDSHEIAQEYWESTVSQEVRVSQFLSKHDMLSCCHRLVKVFPNQNSSSFVYAYVSDSFEFLKSKNIYIIEGKSDKMGTWLKGNNQFLFQNPDDRLNEKCWDEVFEPLLGDISKIVTYGIPAAGDAFNIAIQAQSKTMPTSSKYQVRYFGMDFGCKSENSRLSFKERVHLPPAEMQLEVSSLVSRYVGRVMEIEFHGQTEKVDYSGLKQSLIEKYTKSIAQNLSKIKKLEI